MPIRAVTVYCSSSRHVDRSYLDAAADLGRAIAQGGWGLVYGGNDLGSMGALADAARAAGGKVIGVTPRLLVDQGAADLRCDELIVTDTMRERKAAMEERGDAFIALPGGLGTLEEIFEIIVGKLLGYHTKPIVLLNIAHFYDPLLSMLDHAIIQRFVKPTARNLFVVTDQISHAVSILRQYPATPPPTGIAAPTD